MAGIGIPQVDYGQDPVAFAPGMDASPLGNQGDLYVHYLASEDILPGTVLGLNAGMVRAFRHGDALVGVARRDVKHTNASSFSGPFTTWKAGQQVTVKRKGRIYAFWTGTTQPTLGAANISASTTTATTRGYVTDAATATTAGSEVDAGGAGFVSVKPTGSTSVCLLELNLPA